MAQLYNLKAGVALSTDVVPVLQAPTAAAANGAIAITPSTVVITKSGVCALTLGTPTTAQNGTVITIVAGTAAAHTVTAATIGFNAANGAGDVATFGGAIGDNMTVLAYEGEWLILNSVNVTLG